MSSNIKSAPLLDLKIQNEETPCPIGYKKSTLINFKGFRPGCVCKDGSVYSHEFCLVKSPENC